MQIYKLIIIISLIIGLSACGNDSKDIRLALNAGIKANNRSEFKKAIDFYQKVISMDNANAEAYYNLGNTYYNIKEYDLSLLNANKAIEHNSTYGEAYKLRAELYKKIFKDNDKACENYLKAEEYGVKNLYNYTKFCK